jgi:hypothetical protein
LIPPTPPTFNTPPGSSGTQYRTPPPTATTSTPSPSRTKTTPPPAKPSSTSSRQRPTPSQWAPSSPASNTNQPPFNFTTAATTPAPTPTPISGPQNIRLDPAYTTDLQHTTRFLWDAVPNATTYRHYINAVAIPNEDDATTSETVLNLQPATAYTFTVGAFVAGIEYKSTPFNFTTAATTPAPTPTPISGPQNIRLDPAYTTDLQHTTRFLWDAVPNATTYRHYINAVAIPNEDDATTSETVLNLQPATAYTFTVGAFVAGIEYKSTPFNFTTAGTAPPATAVPQYDRIVVAVFENQWAPSIMASLSAPYLQGLAGSGANLTNMHGLTHPSFPNYLGLYTGQTFGVTTNNCVLQTGTTLADQLQASGKGFIGYAESLPLNGWNGVY